MQICLSVSLLSSSRSHSLSLQYAFTIPAPLLLWVSRKIWAPWHIDNKLKDIYKFYIGALSRHGPQVSKREILWNSSKRSFKSFKTKSASIQNLVSEISIVDTHETFFIEHCFSVKQEPTFLKINIRIIIITATMIVDRHHQKQ